MTRTNDIDRINCCEQNNLFSILSHHSLLNCGLQRVTSEPLREFLDSPDREKLLQDQKGISIQKNREK